MERPRASGPRHNPVEDRRGPDHHPVADLDAGHECGCDDPIESVALWLRNHRSSARVISTAGPTIARLAMWLASGLNASWRRSPSSFTIRVVASVYGRRTCSM